MNLWKCQACRRILIFFFFKQIIKGNHVFRFAVSLFSEAKRNWNIVWSLGHIREYLWPGNKGHRGETRNLSAENPLAEFITHRVKFQGSCPRAWTFQDPGVETIVKRSLKTIVIGNVVNLKYLIRIYFLQKHELGCVCEQCREGMMPLFPWVWLSFGLMSQSYSLEMDSFIRGHLVLGEGQSLKVGSLSSE